MIAVGDLQAVLDALLQLFHDKKMERTKTLPAGTYWCRSSGRFITPDDPLYKQDDFDALTQGPLERGLFGDDEEESYTKPAVRAA